MAVAALQILQLTDRIAQPLPVDRFVPSPGQGCVAIECREDDEVAPLSEALWEVAGGASVLVNANTSVEMANKTVDMIRDAGGTAELVGSGGAGVLVPPGDPDILAAAVRELLDDPERRERLGEAARQRIASEFPLARMIDRYEAALTAVIE